MRRRLIPPSLAALLLAAPAAAGDAPGERGMVRVPAGVFTMGSRQGDPDERPPHRRRLRAFLMDRHEVTQQAYRRCVAAGACRAPRRYPGLDGPRLPVVGVSWHDARAYCRWAGKRLPREAEWERAARGTDRRPFPWGRGLDCRKANFGNYGGAGLCARHNPGRLLPVGSRPQGVSPAGAQDMGGNVWEWVADVYRPYPGGRRTPLMRGRPRVVRGGSCCSYFIMPRAANRLAFPADFRDRDLGFRCAKDGHLTPGRVE
jgi:formylglycine-generating enzyme required for sulfatase activity